MISHLYAFFFLIALMSFAPTVLAQTGTDVQLERQKLELERARLEGELRIHEQELNLRREELQLRREEQGTPGFFKLSAANATIAVALIGLLATAIAAMIQARSNSKTQTSLDRSKFESDLILKSIETGDLAAATRNLKFLLKAGFIKDENGKIASLAEDADAVPVLPPRAYTSGLFEGIPPEGVGGDPEVNVLKNRDQPPKQFTPMTLEAIVALPSPNDEEIGSLPRSQWPPEARQTVERFEAKGIVVEGYIKKGILVGPTAANAKRRDPAGSDFKLWLVSNPTDKSTRTVNAVITPRTRASHQEWSSKRLNELCRSGQKVRISGWLLFGPRNPGSVATATRWRIHPVMNIEVFEANSWKSIP